MITWNVNTRGQSNTIYIYIQFVFVGNICFLFSIQYSLDILFEQLRHVYIYVHIYEYFVFHIFIDIEYKIIVYNIG